MSAENYNSNPQQRLEELETELQMAQPQLEIQRQEIARKFGPEFLAVLDGNPFAKVVVTPVVENLVEQNEQGRIISKTDGVAISVRLSLLGLLTHRLKRKCQDESGCGVTPAPVLILFPRSRQGRLQLTKKQPVHRYPFSL